MSPFRPLTPIISIPDLIRKKRDGLELSETEIKLLVEKVISKDPTTRLHDSQVGAFLMAIYLNGLTYQETSFLTKCMTYSGYTFKWPKSWKGTVVDKHSTGGVGDKVSLVLAPALAACGLRVPMISGRGLDFTGGTLDKLEAIPGFTVLLTKERMKEMLEKVGCCIVGQTEDIVPADKLLYAMRDITATVDKEELIVASIISKKAAEGLDSLILDVKTGRGAMIKDLESSKRLARKMVDVGISFGMKVTALVTNMDTPLGNAVGNALEVMEAVHSLQNKGPADLLELTCRTGGHLLHSLGTVSSASEGEQKIREVINNLWALKKFENMIIGQGVSPNVANDICNGDMWKYLPKANKVIEIKANNSGYIGDIDPLEIARVCHSLGCGRTVPGESVLLEPGIILKKKLGDAIKVGDVLLEVHEGTNVAVSEVHLERLRSSITITNEKAQCKPLIIEVIP